MRVVRYVKTGGAYPMTARAAYPDEKNMSLPPELQAALFGRRVIFVRGRLDATLANSIIAQLLLASRVASDEEIQMYIDSPGGSVTAALSVYDLMQSVSGAQISTTCTGTAGGAAALLVASGAARRRFALPNARIQ